MCESVAVAPLEPKQDNFKNTARVTNISKMRSQLSGVPVSCSKVSKSTSVIQPSHERIIKMATFILTKHYALGLLQARKP